MRAGQPDDRPFKVHRVDAQKVEGFLGWLRAHPSGCSRNLLLAGIQTAAVINVGTATIGGFIGAGGYGETIFRGIQLGNNSLILQGAVPTAVLALLIQGLFELAGRVVVPKGLRLKGG